VSHPDTSADATGGDPLYCVDCGTELTHGDVTTVGPVPQLDPESYAVGGETAEVYRCSGCGAVLGFDLLDA